MDAANVAFLIDVELGKQTHRFNAINWSDIENGGAKFKVGFRNVYQELL